MRLNHIRTNIINNMNIKYMKPEDKARNMHSAWSQASPEASFASITLSQYAQAIQVVTDMSTEIRNLDSLVVTKKASKRAADAVLRNLNKQVVNSVKSTPEYGEDAPLLRAFGHVITSERKSGLHRLPAAPVVPTIVPSGIVMGVNQTNNGGTNAA